jgi:hypothetical protein
MKKLLRAILAQFDKADIPTALLYIGFACVGYGAYQIRPAFGFIAVGLFIIGYVRPLTRWIN